MQEFNIDKLSCDSYGLYFLPEAFLVDFCCFHWFIAVLSAQSLLVEALRGRLSFFFCTLTLVDQKLQNKLTYRSRRSKSLEDNESSSTQNTKSKEGRKEALQVKSTLGFYQYNSGVEPSGGEVGVILSRVRSHVKS